jgi:hypothetical protein
MPSLKRGGGRRVSGRDERSSRGRDGTNASNDFKDIILLVTVKTDRVVNADPNEVAVNEIAAQVRYKKSVFVPEDSSIGLRDCGKTTSGSGEISGVPARADWDGAFFSVEEEAKIVEHVVRGTRVKNSRDGRRKTDETYGSGYGGKAGCSC